MDVPPAPGTIYLCFYIISENVDEKCEPESNDPRKAPDMDHVMNMLQRQHFSVGYEENR